MFLVTDFTFNPAIQLSCEQLSKEENRKEYVDRKVQIHHYRLPNTSKKKYTRAMTDRLMASSVKDGTYYTFIKNIYPINH